MKPNVDFLNRSCLGRFLFFVYGNHLPSTGRNSQVTMYADDTGKLNSSKDIGELCETLDSNFDSHIDVEINVTYLGYNLTNILHGVGTSRL